MSYTRARTPQPALSATRNQAAAPPRPSYPAKKQQSTTSQVFIYWTLVISVVTISVMQDKPEDMPEESMLTISQLADKVTRDIKTSMLSMFEIEMVNETGKNLLVPHVGFIALRRI
jgi:hypothetical protein